MYVINFHSLLLYIYEVMTHSYSYLLCTMVQDFLDMKDVWYSKNKLTGGARQLTIEQPKKIRDRESALLIHRLSWQSYNFIYVIYDKKTSLSGSVTEWRTYKIKEELDS